MHLADTVLVIPEGMQVEAESVEDAGGTVQHAEDAEGRHKIGLYS